MKAAILLIGCALLVGAVGCDRGDPAKYKMSDAQLGLTAEQAAGRRIYNEQCLHCHASYTSEGRVAMSLRGLFKKASMPSGVPANDERVSEVIVRGKRMMPAIPMSPEQLAAVLAYLHTL